MCHGLGDYSTVDHNYEQMVFINYFIGKSTFMSKRKKGQNMSNTSFMIFLFGDVLYAQKKCKQYIA